MEMLFNTSDFSNIVNLIKYPSLTEKSINLYGSRQYTFIVDRKLKKPEIKFAIEKLFNVSIEGLSTCMIPPKTKRVGKFVGKRSQYKKAFITLKDGDTITELFN
jgi:large subunit ribosomal protein L23